MMQKHFRVKGFALAIALLSTACSLPRSSKPVGGISMNPNEILLVAGSYSPADVEGIRLYSFDQKQGSLRSLKGFAGVANPSYVAPSADGRLLYAVSESDSPSDALYTFRFDKETRRVSVVDSICVGGAAPCYVAEGRDGTMLFTANYGGGSLTAVALSSEGTMPRGTKQVYSFTSSVQTADRKRASHAHFVALPNDSTIWVSDLGLDSIHIFTMHKGTASAHTSVLQGEEGIKLPSGYGPRHIAFTPNGRYAYIITELAGKVLGLRQEGKRWEAFTEVQADSLHSHGSADIHISPDGLFLYSSHRLKADGIAIHRIQADGTLLRVGYQLTGRHPRNFALSPNGEYLLVACRDSDSIEVYKRDVATGLLTPLSQRAIQPKVSSLRFLGR